jgi:hypothetical protein
MDRRRRCWNREYRHCSLAHVRHHAFPISRRLPSHARRTDDTFAAAAELFHEESCAGCSAELL